MTALTLQLSVLILAAIFAGIVLFLALVLKPVLLGITEAEYYAVFTRLIRHGRKSILINGIMLLPILLLIVYLVLYGFENPLFITGIVIYVIGSLGISRAINEPAYTRLLALRPESGAAINELRSRINQGNLLRAVISTLGVILIGVSLVV